VNIFGGFLVTQRMLAMYRKKERPKPSAGKAGVEAVLPDKRA
jgi:NAD(P) transhydrogenase subunit alpha